MCNCGNKSAAFIAAQKDGHFSHAGNLQQSRQPAEVKLEYTGRTALTTTGIVTGRTYRFNKPGDILYVDYRDSLTMMNIPVLKRRS
ncbi:hypothetical protein QTN47_19065 [Danxiaibacter flavus]|uniref:Uncharacterized protein n=1 Tax=Danxiaibacter flavus TaxID=3049108 RepID=A0ABV3ZM17_9BACT|nr:hypothetical protein QNM32_19075 [Chitinophagaceae bacterium DXS]